MSSGSFLLSSIATVTRFSVAAILTAEPIQTKGLVGLGRLELPTSPLSGVRSSHLSYRPVPLSQRSGPEISIIPSRSTASKIGGAGRDRTGDLLNANQALSQLSYSPSSLGIGAPLRTRRPGRKLSRPIGRRRPAQWPDRQSNSQNSEWRNPETNLSFRLIYEVNQMDWKGCHLLSRTRGCAVP